MTTRTNDRGRSRARRLGWTTVGAAALVGSVSLVVASGSAAGSGWEAVAVLRDVADNDVGKVKFEGDERGTEVTASLHGIVDGLDAYHGFHLHANGAGAPCDPTVGFTNVGGHWNPGAADHGKHKGDLPTILVLADGTGTARFVTGRFAPSEIEDRAVILHIGPDNYANIPSRYSADAVAGPDTATKSTGDAGGRIACGIVELD